MAGFMKSKEEVMAILLTQYGRKLLSQGNLKVKYYRFMDENVDYQTPISSPVITGSIDVAPSNVSAPVITGLFSLGETLSTTDGIWSGTGPISYSYQWKRDGINIASATNNTYVIVDADLNTTITCTITATNSVGSASSTSNSMVWLANLVGWYRADYGVGFTGSGVGTWLDKSGFNNHLAQTTDASRALFLTASANGQPAVLFDGVDDWIHLNPFNWQADVDQYLVAVMFRQLSGTVNDQFISYGTNLILRGISGDKAQLIGPGGLVSSDTNDPLTTTTNNLVLLRWTGLSQSVYLNGPTPLGSIVNTTTAFGSASNRLSVAANSAGGTNPYAAISEVIVMRSSGSNSEISGIISYHNRRYLTASSPVASDVLSIPGLTLFLDHSTLTSSTGYFNWSNRAGTPGPDTNNNFTQSSAATMPQTGAILGGYPAADFRLGNWMSDSVGNVASIYSSNGHSGSVFIATMPYYPSLSNAAIYSNHVLFGDTGLFNALGYESGSAGNVGFRFYVWDSGDRTTPRIAHSPNTPAVVEGRFAVGSTNELRVNNYITGNTVSFNGLGSIALPMRIGLNATSGFFTGTISAVVAFNRKVSDTEAATVRRYLANTYAIPMISGGFNY